MERRGFLGAILAAGFAPAFVGASVLMPVREIVLADPTRLADFEFGALFDMLAKANEILADMPWIESNGKGSVVVRTGLPKSYWRAFNPPLGAGRGV